MPATQPSAARNRTRGLHARMQIRTRGSEGERSRSRRGTPGETSSRRARDHLLDPISARLRARARNYASDIMTTDYGSLSVPAVSHRNSDSVAEAKMSKDQTTTTHRRKHFPREGGTKRRSTRTPFNNLKTPSGLRRTSRRVDRSTGKERGRERASERL